MQRVDVGIVGGGVAGCALGGALARDGLDVLVLERTTHFQDRVRGEWMAPWGVAEAKRLGVYEALMAAGGHHLKRHVAYDELVSPADAEAGTMPIDQLHPGSPGPLCLEHVRIQASLLELARESGARVLRGASDVRVTAGAAPSLRYRHSAVETEVACRWIVAADGRSSAVRRQLGIELLEDPIDHLIAGLLIDETEGWPDDLQAMGKVGDIAYLVFPQGHGKIRLYADFDLSGRARFAGNDGAQKLLEAFRMDCVPRSEFIANARPIGPCRSYPSQDARVETPMVEGVALIGDAAGYNDPIIGQGLSISLRDARWVHELLTSGEPWRTELFVPYAEERAERMRRLRLAARYITRLYARFDERGVRRRQHAFAALKQKPELGMVQLAAFSGPESVPDEYFEPGFMNQLFGS